MQEFSVRVNAVEVPSVTAFARTEGRFQQFQKDTLFVRLIGFEEREAYLEEIAAMDAALGKKQADFGVGYLRVAGLEMGMSQEQASRFIRMLEAGEFPFHFENTMWERAMVRSFSSVLGLFGRAYPQANATIVRNFSIKLLGWMEQYLPQLFLKTRGLGNFPKLVLSGPIKMQEYLFLWLLVQLGCDVLYLNPKEDLPEQFGMLLDFSRVHEKAGREAMEIPLSISRMEGEKTLPAPSPCGQNSPTAPLRMDAERFRRKEREQRAPSSVTARAAASREPGAQDLPRRSLPRSSREELSYEELAGFAASVVMIHVYNDKRESIKTGSGVFINGEGYVLTNFHVVSGGACFGVRLEEQSEIFYTERLIKYHNLNDLALLKIDVTSAPIPLYQGDRPLRRGQKVVAIGSPLGLFNSVSDGIVSGFRKLDEVSMVQFTAPTSPGSSGGALLDLYGNLIGILTAGFDGQNLNLAVDYNTVRGFVRGFL